MKLTKTKLNPVNVGCTRRASDGVREAPCCVNPGALLRVLGLAERYLKEHPAELERFKDDVAACAAAGEIYTTIWEAINA